MYCILGNINILYFRKNHTLCFCLYFEMTLSFVFKTYYLNHGPKTVLTWHYWQHQNTEYTYIRCSSVVVPTAVWGLIPKKCMLFKIRRMKYILQENITENISYKNKTLNITSKIHYLILVFCFLIIYKFRDKLCMITIASTISFLETLLILVLFQRIVQIGTVGYRLG